TGVQTCALPILISSHKGIRKIIINDNIETGYKTSNLTKLRADDPYMFNVFDQLREYLNGERKKFNLPIDIKGTEFQKKVWNELNKIPRSEEHTSELQSRENLVCRL